MTDEHTPLFEYDFGQPSGLKIIFNSVEELKLWFACEEESWKWLTTKPISDGYQNQIKSVINQSINNVKSSMLDFTRNINTNTVNNLKNNLSNIFISGNIPLSITPRAKFINELKDKDADQAIYVLGYYLGINPPQTSPRILKGYFAALLFENNLKDTAGNEKTALDALLNDLNTKITDANRILHQLKIDISNSNTDLLARKEKNNKEFDALVAEKKKNYEDLYKTTETTLKNIERTYDEKLALQSAVIYWKVKANSHLKSSWVFGILSVLMGILATYGIYVTVDKFIGSEKLLEVQFWQLSLIAMEAVFGVWLTRVFIRIYLSNMHLLTDAKERRTHLLTYLALLRKGHLQPTDQKLILQALFRPTSTGIIKDDAAPPFIAEWIKKTIGNE